MNLFIIYTSKYQGPVKMSIYDLTNCVLKSLMASTVVMCENIYHFNHSTKKNDRATQCVSVTLIR